MTNVNKLNVRSVYAWPIGPNGFEGVFIICPNDENIIELTDNMKRHQKYDEFVFITEERKISKARDLYIVEHSDYHKLNANTNNNEYIYYTRFRFRCKKFS
ncbi:MAG TPA: hypothetical protein VE244_11540 [Nitrososphaeraceae archaeon]|jgi:hypothetical protein|nr:hypothetical protein [Nitrososphaeraceae archaeon]